MVCDNDASIGYRVDKSFEIQWESVFPILFC